MEESIETSKIKIYKVSETFLKVLINDTIETVISNLERKYSLAPGGSSESIIKMELINHLGEISEEWMRDMYKKLDRALYGKEIKEDLSCQENL